MGYVDLRNSEPVRRYEDPRRPAPNYSTFLMAAAVLVLPLGWLAMLFLFQDALVPTVVVLVLLLVALLMDGRDRRTRPGAAEFGGEKQLLMALRDLSSLGGCVRI